MRYEGAIFLLPPPSTFSLSSNFLHSVSPLSLLHCWPLLSVSLFSSLPLSSPSCCLLSFRSPSYLLPPPLSPPFISPSLNSSDLFLSCSPFPLMCCCAVAVATCDLGHSVQPLGCVCVCSCGCVCARETAGRIMCLKERISVFTWKWDRRHE